MNSRGYRGMPLGVLLVAVGMLMVGCEAVAPGDGNNGGGPGTNPGPGGNNNNNGSGGQSNGCDGPTATNNADDYFVAGNAGNDANSGSQEDPLSTIQAAIELADQSGGGNIHVASGVYSESIELRSNINLFGGYDANSWTQCPDENPTTIVGGTTAMFGENIQSAKINGLTIISSEAGSDESSVAVRLVDSSNVEIYGNRIVAGDGGNGSAGLAGETGAGGATGNNGANAGACPPDRDGGSGASSDLGVGGGSGGRGGAAGGFGGSKGGGAHGGVGGQGGALGTSGDEGQRGNVDNPADIGEPGEGGLGIGTLEDGFYTPADGGDGTKGENGSGGGGGGGGGGALVFACGGGGGGGGAGGEGGDGGLGGLGGGASIGIVLANSTDIMIDDNVIETGVGGNGGDAGEGGNGGSGGNGGTGGSRFGGQGPGRNGGKGGDGGQGGAGGGGGGGPVVGIFEDAASTSTRTGNRVILGTPGDGGLSPDGTNGEPGEAGAFVKIDDEGAAEIFTAASIE
ncbi:MAG: hypothetical protein KDA54_12020 [Phycisphaerales bacterium]|nr:hypothetical protein [Phycisphaerales bacterium]